jgi:hypothetical protein
MRTDDRITQRMLRSPVLPRTDDVAERIGARRQTLIRRRRAGAMGLGLVVIALFAVTIATLAPSEAPTPIVPASPSPTSTSTAADGTVRIEGVPFPVCRPVSTPGDFGSGLDTAWLFEEERVPGAGCIGSEGFPRIAIGTPDTVVAMSVPFRNYADGLWPWPYATPDVDGDGVDEIAIGIEGSRGEGYALLVLFRVVDDGAGPEVAEVTLDCGEDDCETPPWIGVGTFVESLEGAYCGAFTEIGTQGMMRWSAMGDQVRGELWVLDGTALRRNPDIGIGPTWDLETDPLPVGTEDLCGSPVHWPDELPSEP